MPGSAAYRFGTQATRPATPTTQLGPGTPPDPPVAFLAVGRRQDGGHPGASARYRRRRGEPQEVGPVTEQEVRGALGRAIGAPQPRRRRRAAPSRLRPGDAAVRRRLGGRSRPDRPHGGGSTWSRSSSFATASSGGTPAGSATRSGRRHGARSGGAHAGTAANGNDAGVGRRTLQAVQRRADRPAGQRRLASTSQVSETITGGPSWSWSCQVPTMVPCPQSAYPSRS
jgi:hypothetical protein